MPVCLIEYKNHINNRFYECTFVTLYQILACGSSHINSPVELTKFMIMTIQMLAHDCFVARYPLIFCKLRALDRDEKCELCTFLAAIKEL